MNRSSLGVKALYAAAAIPLGAAFQGYYFLSTYRREHGDAPFPITPSSGVVVVQNIENTRNKDKVRKYRFGYEVDKIRPLRLLVVGDSLAAGVGITQSGTPILPESIAMSLSLELNGRPVYWTCVGTPGASTRRIIADIELYHQQQELNQTLHFKSVWNPKGWLDTLKSFIKAHSHQTISCNPETVPVSSYSNEHEQKRYSLYQKIFRVIKGKLQVIIDKLNELKDPDEDDMIWKRWRDNLRASDTHYDVVVVLTGLNDFKSIFLPFLSDLRNSARFSDELQRLLETLQTKMKLKPKRESSSNIYKLSNNDNSHRENLMQQKKDKSDAPIKTDKALIVLPAIPTNPINFLRYPPLSWLAFPLFQMIESQKRALALENPGSILYVEEPTVEILDEIETGKGLLHAKKKIEDVTFRLTDLSRKAKAKIEDIMAQRQEVFNNRHGRDDFAERIFEESFYTHSAPELSENQKSIGSSLISYDRLHPNEIGYDFYGRHIAAAIIEELGRD